MSAHKVTASLKSLLRSKGERESFNPFFSDKTIVRLSEVTYVIAILSLKVGSFLMGAFLIYLLFHPA